MVFFAFSVLKTRLTAAYRSCLAVGFSHGHSNYPHFDCKLLLFLYLANFVKLINSLASASLAGFSLFFPATTVAREVPLDTWKSIMDNAQTQYDKGNVIGACTNATNLAHFMNVEVYEVGKTGDQSLERDVRFLMWDWQTFVGKYCGGRPLLKKSRLWNDIDQQ